MCHPTAHVQTVVLPRGDKTKHGNHFLGTVFFGAQGLCTAVEHGAPDQSWGVVGAVGGCSAGQGDKDTLMKGELRQDEIWLRQTICLGRRKEVASDFSASIYIGFQLGYM